MTTAIRMTNLNYGIQAAVMAIAMEIIHRTPCTKQFITDGNVSDAFITRRCFAVVKGLVYTDLTGSVATADVYVMRTASLRGPITGIAVKTGDAWLYDEEVGMEFNQLMDAWMSQYKSPTGFDCFHNWMTSAAFPAYINKVVEQSAVH